MKTTGSPAGFAEVAGMIATVVRMVRVCLRVRFSGTSRNPHRPGIGSGVSGHGPGTNRAGWCPGRGPSTEGARALLDVGPSAPITARPAATSAVLVRARWGRLGRGVCRAVRRRTVLPVPRTDGRPSGPVICSAM
ncbi:hypothetical protein GCM10010230_23000 [Streptomyces narbonensis]|nr:hypothetical protein GCM10010230_23000 [Streptomyces narbonensis]